MIKKSVLLLCGMLLMASVAGAEHKMFVTDVLDRGEIEAEANFSYYNYSFDYTRTSPVYQQGKVNQDAASVNLSTSIGIVNGLQVGIALPYVFSNQWTEEYTNPFFPSQTNRADGLGDLSFGAKYRLVGGNSKPYTLVSGLTIKPDTADKNRGTGTTDIVPYIAISTTLLEGKLRPFSEYSIQFRNKGASDDHRISLGAEYAHNRWLALAPAFIANFRTESTTYTSSQYYTFELQNRMEILHNFYLVPGFDYTIDSDNSRRDNSANYTNRSEVAGNIRFYYLFK